MEEFLIRALENTEDLDAYLKPLFEKISGFYMQSPLDSERIIEIGADRNKVETLGNLKFDIELERLFS